MLLFCCIEDHLLIFVVEEEKFVEELGLNKIGCSSFPIMCMKFMLSAIGSIILEVLHNIGRKAFKHISLRNYAEFDELRDGDCPQHEIIPFANNENFFHIANFIPLLHMLRTSVIEEMQKRE